MAKHWWKVNYRELTLQQTAILGREHGAKQKNSKEDELAFQSCFATKQQYAAYVTAFYRGCGYSGSGNRRVRRFVKDTV